MASGRGSVISAAQLAELTAALRDLDDDIGDLAMSLLEDISRDIAADVRARVPYRTGRARQSYKVTGHSITFGGEQAPYVPWLEFGGKVGRKKTTKRPYIRKGRYLYPAIAENLDDIEKRVDDLISQITGGFLTVEN